MLEAHRENGAVEVHVADTGVGIPAAELESLPLYIDDTPGLTIAALRTRAPARGAQV